MNRKAFTLIELLAVIVILGIITLIAIPSVSNIIKNSKEKVAFTNAKTFLSEVEKYAIKHDLDSGTYPFDLKGKTLKISEDNDDDYPSLNEIINMKENNPEKGTVTIDSKGKVTNAEMYYSSIDKSVVYNSNKYILKTNSEWLFNYITNDSNNLGYHIFTVPYDGKYKFEAKGAQGGGYKTIFDYLANSVLGGYGSKTEGEIELTKGTKIYIYVGGAGSSNCARDVDCPGGYNGGGTGYTATKDANPIGNYNYTSAQISTGGGGSTDFRVISGKWNDAESLKSRIMVAAGGGGSGLAQNNSTKKASYGYGGYGALNGGSGYDGYNKRITSYSGSGATQKSAGNYAGFGYGADYSDKTYGGSGGGSGYYGGGSSIRGHAGGGGGSSFINGHVGCVTISDVSISKYTFSNTVVTPGGTSNYIEELQTTSSTIESENGYAKITYIE